MHSKVPISHNFNLAHNARLANFHGWQMPTFYTGIIEEYKTTRNHIGLFDVSHMGRWWVTGRDAGRFLNYLVTNDISRLKEQKGIYTPMLNENAGIIDDLIIYKFTAEKFLLVNNAGNHASDSQWYREQLKRASSSLAQQTLSLTSFGDPGSVNFEDITDTIGQIAVQGPKAKQVCEELLRLGKSLPYFSFETNDNNILITKHQAKCVSPVIIAATGYTGEQGYELYGPNEILMSIWQELINKYSAKPCGLGARDLLRLEAGYCLHGNDINIDTTPFEAGLEWTVKMDKSDFIGKTALETIPPKKKLVGLAFPKREKIIPRAGLKIFSTKQVNTNSLENSLLDDNYIEIGHISSGNFSPNLDRGMALGYVDIDFYKNCKQEQRIHTVIRDKFFEAQLCEPWFYRNIRGLEIQL